MAKKIGVCQFIEMAKVVHGNKYDYTRSNLINFSTKIKISCLSCKDKYGSSKSYFHKRPTDHISGNQGCPKCSKGKSEKLFGECLHEVVPKLKFKKVRPKFLRVGSSNLELDYYCEKLKLAFEINGAQHYEYSSFFHRNYYNFMSLTGRDSVKKYLCEKNEVELVSVDLRDYSVKNRREEFLDFIYKFFKDSKC